MNLPAIDWIFFDLDGTLWDHDAASQHAIMAVCERYGLPPMSFIPLFRESNLHMWREMEQGRADFETLRVRRFEMALGQLSCGCSPIDTLEMSRHYNDVYTRESWPMPGVEETIAAAATRARLAILTNAPRITQEGKLNHLALPPDTFQFILCAGDTPWLKPETAYFHEALARAGNPDPQSVLMVGDSWEGDIATPATLGWQTAWISHRKEPPGEASGTMIFATLQDFGRWIAERT